VNKKGPVNPITISTANGHDSEAFADWKSRETICMAVRFTVRWLQCRGRLCCTDQGGGTWMPNGNPFDELLNIKPGRHYGFPPRHPKYLPDVIDETKRVRLRTATPVQLRSSLQRAKWMGRICGRNAWQGDAIIAGDRVQNLAHEDWSGPRRDTVAHTDLSPASRCWR